MKRFQFRVWKFAKDRIFGAFDLIYYGNTFIVVFESVYLVVYTRDDFRRKSILVLKIINVLK